MIIDNQLLANLSSQAKVSPRLRMNFDMRNNEEDKQLADAECLGAWDGDADS